MTREKRHTWESPTRLREDCPTMPRSSILFRNSIANRFMGLDLGRGPGALPVDGRDKGRGEAFGKARKKASRAHLFMILARIACFLPGKGRKKPGIRINLAARVSRCFKKTLKSALFFLLSLETPPGKAIFAP